MVIRNTIRLALLGVTLGVGACATDGSAPPAQTAAAAQQSDLAKYVGLWKGNWGTNVSTITIRSITPSQAQLTYTFNDQRTDWTASVSGDKVRWTWQNGARHELTLKDDTLDATFTNASGVSRAVYTR